MAASTVENACRDFQGATIGLKRLPAPFVFTIVRVPHGAVDLYPRLRNVPIKRPAPRFDNAG